ncbi:hypothetical protein G9A89_012429 [Geosiphon pyriformis]|nr:hypothetical protein G9A89_012429 [Geosiphon pyriformis]
MLMLPQPPSRRLPLRPLAKTTCDRFTYCRQTNKWTFAWIYEIQRQVRQAQTDHSIHAVSMDPGIRTPFTLYSPTKYVDKIGSYKLITSSKRKKAKARRLEKTIVCMRQKMLHLQTEIYRKAVTFSHGFEALHSNA